MMKKINWNWGTGITIVIILFLILAIGTTIFFMNQKVDLVASDYYKRGIEHQRQIEKETRSNALGDSVTIFPEAGFIKLTFPKPRTANEYKGKIQFYRPSDSSKDFIVDLKIDPAGLQLIPVKNIIKGYWHVQIDWSRDSIEYYKESSFVIN